MKPSTALWPPNHQIYPDIQIPLPHSQKCKQNLRIYPHSRFSFLQMFKAGEFFDKYSFTFPFQSLRQTNRFSHEQTIHFLKRYWCPFISRKDTIVSVPCFASWYISILIWLFRIDDVLQPKHIFGIFTPLPIL